MADADVVSCCLHAFFCALYVADPLVGMEELKLQYRCRGRSNSRKIKIATISVRMVLLGKPWWLWSPECSPQTKDGRKTWKCHETLPWKSLSPLRLLRNFFASSRRDSAGVATQISALAWLHYTLAFVMPTVVGALRWWCRCPQTLQGTMSEDRLQIGKSAVCWQCKSFMDSKKRGSC